MNCIVTAGPTYEPLDEVRRLTNFSTGRLGSDLANYLSDRGHTVQLLLGEQATWRAPVRANVQIFSTTSDLRERLQAASKAHVDAIFHAAAVSDFKFGTVWQRNDDGKLVAIQSGKIPTNLANLLVELSPTPKVIADLRAWFPTAVIVGWKYEVDGDRTSVLVKATKQIAENKTDACVANGPAYGEGFGLVRRTGRLTELADTSYLFAALESLCLQPRQ